MQIKKILWQAYNGHVLIIAFMIGLFAMVLIGLQQSLGRAEASVKEALSVVVFLQNDLSETDAETLVQSMKNQDPEIVSMTYTSKEQAYEEAMRDPNLAKSLVLLKNNPLPPSFMLRYSDRAWWERPEPARNLTDIPAIQEIRWDPQARSLFLSLHRWRLWVLRFSGFAAMVLLVWAFIGLYRFLLLNSRPREIAVTLGVGAAGGILAWGLWGVGLHTTHAEISVLNPVWLAAIPLAIGAATGMGCFGLEVRHAD
jgi:cell division protein FtsX